MNRAQKDPEQARAELATMSPRFQERLARIAVVARLSVLACFDHWRDYQADADRRHVGATLQEFVREKQMELGNKPEWIDQALHQPPMKETSPCA